jgi:hypothetical protein
MTPPKASLGHHWVNLEFHRFNLLPDEKMQVKIDTI